MNKKGFTLIEVLLAVFITTVGILALYNGISYSYNSIQKAKDKFTAAYLGQEGIEIVKSIRDSNYKAGSDWDLNLTSCSGVYGCRAEYDDYTLTVNTGEDESKTLLKVADSSLYNYSIGDDSYFSRKIVITTIDSESKLISVTVCWGSNEFLIEEIIYNWRRS